MKNLAKISAVLLTFLIVSCNDKPNSELGQNEESNNTEKMESAGGSEELEEENEEEGVVKISTEQAQTIELQMSGIEEKTLGNNIKVTGMLELFPQDKANISPFVGGNVKSIKVIEGDKVRKGEVLAYLEHPDIISMQQEYQEKNDELVFLKQDFEESRPFMAKGFPLARNSKWHNQNFVRPPQVLTA